MKLKRIFSNVLSHVFGLSLFFGLMSCSTQMSESKFIPSMGNNGNFEIVDDNLPVNWLVYTKNTVKTGDFTITFDKTDFKAGTQSLHFDVKSCSGEGGRFSPGISQEQAAKEGDVYRIKFWAKNNGSSFKFCVNGVSAFGRGEPIYVASNNTSAEWMEYTCTYTVPKGMDKLRLEFNVLQPGNVWIDEVLVEKF